MEDRVKNELLNSAMITAYKLRTTDSKMTVKQISKILGVDVRTVLRWFKAITATGKALQYKVNRNEQDVIENINEIVEILLKTEPNTPSAKVYLLSDSRYQKIGISIDVKKRLDSIQGCNPLKVSVVATYNPANKASTLEKKLHKHFCKQRMQREWFDINLTEDEFIALCKEYDKE